MRGCGIPGPQNTAEKEGVMQQLEGSRVTREEDL
jgi:hypothetical protein